MIQAIQTKVMVDEQGNYTEEAKQIVLRSELMVDKIRQFHIKTPENYAVMGEFLKKIKTERKTLNGEKDEALSPLKEWSQRIKDFFAKPERLLAEAETLIKNKMISYQEMLERKRREEEERLRKQNEKKAEKINERAEKWAEKGNEDKAEALREEAQAVEASAPSLVSQQPKVEGQSFREVWKFEVVNEDELDREFLTPDLAYIGKIVRATKGRKQIKGVRIYCEKTMSSRGV